MKSLGFSCLVFLSLIAKAQVNDVSYIPDSLRKGADVVKRDEEYILTIQSTSKYTIYKRHVYTILNSEANQFAGYKTSYDKFCSINSVSGKMFNAMGKETKHTKKNEWTDNSAYDGFSLLSDERYKKNEFYCTDYPYTVEYEEDDEYNGTQGFPNWRPQSYPMMSVQNSKFTIIAPANYKVRYKEMNINTDPIVTQKGDEIKYTWELKNIPAKKNEVYAPSLAETSPSIVFAPSKFEVQGFDGDMSTWEGYGRFMFQLIKGRDVLPDAIKKQVHDLTDNVKNVKEKVFILYDFLQKNTRYISIQLGIGGWQPFEASYVAEKKYGDCKALSNYMIALLKEAGITGKYVEIYGGTSPPPFIKDFSSSQSNHVISCVPIGKDTIWLECTSQTGSPGYMGSFTGNRDALIIDETGGHLVRTPKYTSRDNMQVRKVSAIADEQGNVNADIYNKYTGIQQDLPHALMFEFSNEERQKYLNQMFNIPTYEVIKSDYKEHKAIIPSVEENLQIQLNNYATITGRRFFITPNIFGGDIEKLIPDSARQNEFIIRDAYCNIDSIEIKVPSGYIPENIPTEVKLQTKFGKYTSSVKVVNDRIIYFRSMEQDAGRFPPNEFNDLVKFYNQVEKSDRSRVVLARSS